MSASARQPNANHLDVAVVGGPGDETAETIPMAKAARAKRVYVG
jgi:hypothetical protein